MAVRHCRCALALFAVALATALTACGTTGGGRSPEPEAPRSADTPLVSRSDLVVPTGKKTRAITTTVTGQVEEGVEAGCTILRTNDGRTFTLVGRVEGLLDLAQPVTVRGRVDPELMSHCMQGPVFVVESVDGS